MNMYVGNLSYNVTEDDLREEFAKFGNVSSVKIISDQYSNQSKGFGFVEMSDSSDANEAMKSLDGSDLKGRNMKVNEAKPRENRPSNRY